MSLDTLIAGLSLSPQQTKGLIAALTKSSASDSPPALEYDLASTTDVSAHDTASATAPSISTPNASFSAHIFSEDVAAEAFHNEMNTLINRTTHSQHRVPSSPTVEQWKEETLILKDELRRAIAAITAINNAASPLQTHASCYHIPSESDTGPFYAVTKGKDIGVFSGW
jgi:uncharacterized protein YdcH (DUF465 family)